MALRSVRTEDNLPLVDPLAYPSSLRSVPPLTSRDGSAGPADGGFTPTDRHSVRSKPAWLTVCLVVVILTIAALPGTITAGVSPILIVSTAVILVLSIFGKD
jgi:hypothetical protein